jgi:glycosyltransferase involved in cell wall biosynthesis
MMVDGKKVSIVVPIYNTGALLNKCIDSILNQTYRDIEVLLVNDGSTDESGKICDIYAENNHNVKVIHKENSGVSATRNVGINAATGHYIQFVDSDDYIEPNMIETLIAGMRDRHQLVICGYKLIYVDENNNTIHEDRCPTGGEYSINEFLTCFGELFTGYFINSPCNKLYCMDILRSFGVCFIENINMGEDLLFNLEYIKKCKSINIINDSLYNYIRTNDKSLTASFRIDFFNIQQILYSRVRELLIQNDCYTGKNKIFIETSYTDTIIGCLENLFHPHNNLTRKNRNNYISEIIFDDCTRNNIFYFSNGNIQKSLIGALIRYKSVIGIYFYFKTKMFIRNNTKLLFRLFKKINNK